jgi:hypothetical protein
MASCFEVFQARWLRSVDFPAGARSTRDEQVLAGALDAVEDGLLLGGEGYAHGASVPSRFRPPILREVPA